MTELREAIAGYLSRLHAPLAASLTADRIAVTSAGVNALALIGQCLFEPGDRVAIVTPVWPNLTAFPRIMGAQVAPVVLDFDRGAWSLDLDRLLDAAPAGTRAVIVNSPNNPTGWTMPQPQWDALLAHCRQHGIWLVADDAYERIVPDGAAHAPACVAGHRRRSLSERQHVLEDWPMTGWRLRLGRRADASSRSSAKSSNSTLRARRPSCSWRA
jgi:aspartate/methionine/tyrosine aminotransferase